MSIEKIAKHLRKDAEKLWKKLGSSVRHPTYKNAVCDSAGTCYSTAYWIRKKLEPHHKVELVRSTDRKYPHHAWVRIDGTDVDITGDQFGFPSVQIGQMPYKGVLRSWSKGPAPHIETMALQKNTYLPGTEDPQVVALHAKWEELTKKIERAYEYGDQKTAEALEVEAARIQDEMEGRESAYRESARDEYREEHSVGLDAELARMYRDYPTRWNDEDSANFAEAVRHTLIEYGVSFEKAKELSNDQAEELAREAWETRRKIVHKYKETKKQPPQDLKKWIAQAKRRKKLHPNPADRIMAVWVLVNEVPQLLQRLGLPTEPHELVLKIIGSGEYAVVFGIDDKRVLKITTDLDDAAAAEAVRRHGRTRGLVEIFEVGRIPRSESDEPDMFVIIAERVMTYPKVSKGVEVAAYLAKILRHEFMRPRDAADVEDEDYDTDTTRGLKAIDEEYLEEFARKKGYEVPPLTLIRKFAGDFLAAERTAWKLGFTIDQDLHMNNVGYRETSEGLEAVVIDYGYQSWIRGEKPKLELVANPKLIGNGPTVDEAIRVLSQAPGLLKRLGTTLEELRSIGEGAYANVFAISGDRVLKVTWDGDDAAIAEMVKGKSLRGVMKVDEVYESPIKGYFIVAERLKVFQNNASDPLMATLALSMDAEWDWEEVQWNEYASSQYSSADVRLAQLLKQDLKAGLENIRALGGSVRDISVWNVGLRKGRDRWELAILDFGHMSWKHGRPSLEMAKNPSKLQKAFDHWFDRLEKAFPDFGNLELHSDKKAHDGGRHYGYCKHEDEEISIAFAPETEELSENNIKGLMAHEFGHALDFRYGKALEKTLGKLPRDVEERADAIANRVFSIEIQYDQNLVQCISCRGISPRPKGLR